MAAASAPATASHASRSSKAPNYCLNGLAPRWKTLPPERHSDGARLRLHAPPAQQRRQQAAAAPVCDESKLTRKRRRLHAAPDGGGAVGELGGGSGAPVGLAEAEGTTALAAASLAAAEVEEAAADAAATAEGDEADAAATTGGSDGAAGAQAAAGQLSELLGLAVPALGMVLADPLMSLIDVACVGRVSSVQLAALGPNTAVFNFAFQLFAFLGVGTTSLIASNSLRAPGLSATARAARREAAERTLCHSLQLAAACGLVAGGVLLAGGPTFFSSMGTAPELMVPAGQYLSIRVVAAPAVLVMAVCQGACLGQQDAWTPFAVLLATGLLNAVGDVYLIWCLGMGVAGAAAATAAAQYAGAAFFLWHLQRQGRRKGGIRLRWMGLPRLGQMQEFLTIAATLFTRTIFGMAAYFSMTAAATQIGTLATATHQVAMQTFWFLSYFPEPLSLAAQTLLARDRRHPEQASPLAWLLLRSGAALGLGLAAAVGAVFCKAAGLFTGDAAVQAGVRQLAPLAMLAIAVCSVMMMFDGISVGSGSFAHLPPSNVAGLAVTLAVLHVGRQAGLGLAAVWWALIAFYGTRLLGHLVHFARSGGGVFAGPPAGSTAAAAAAG